MPYKNAKINHSHMRLVVRKVWRLYIRWEKTQHAVDYNLYLNERELAASAIATGPAAWAKEFILP